MFDYLIVGGGSAGCVLANRLSTDGRYSVCLIEAGPADRNPLIHVPLGVVPLVRGWFANWKFWSEPQPHLDGRRTYQPRGKTLGGCSSINATVCTRGHRWDYDHWASLGCDGWSYEDVLPYFKRSENYDAPLSEQDRPFHGQGGPLNVTTCRSTNPLSEAFIGAGMQAGHRLNEDFNGHEQEGVGLFRVFQKNGLRCSNAKAYLTPDVRARPNLKVLTGAQVTQVLLEGGRAVGVKLRRAGREETLLAQREVILSAGAFQSPQLLMLSGIGPAEELRRHDIPLVQELPGVGQNLQDHLEVIVETRAKSHAGMSLRPMGLLRCVIALFLFMFGRRGMLTSNGAEAGGFFRSSPQEPRPDFQWHFGPFPNLYHGFRLAPMFKRYGYIVYMYELRPKSVGRIGLRSRDPLAPPLIDPNYLADERDVDKLVKALRVTRELLRQRAFDAHRDVELSPGPAVQTDEQLRDWVRQAAETTYHPVGTCKMGTDAMAVVDPHLRVRGIAGLRVVDASVLPTLVGSNTNAPTTMIAEKAADMILETAASQQPQHS